MKLSAKAGSRTNAFVNGVTQLQLLALRRVALLSVLRAPHPPTLRPSFLELRREVTRLKREGAYGLTVDFTYRGLRRQVKNAERDPELASAGFIDRFYMKTRLLAVDRYGACRW